MYKLHPGGKKTLNNIWGSRGWGSRGWGSRVWGSRGYSLGDYSLEQRILDLLDHMPVLKKDYIGPFNVNAV